MAKTKRGTKKPKAKGPTKRKVAPKRAPRIISKSKRAAPRKGAGKTARKIARPKARKGARGGSRTLGPVAVTVETVARVVHGSLLPALAVALNGGETAQLHVGKGEEGGRVETLVFTPSGKAAQTSGSYVHVGVWNGTRVLTDKGHFLDTDGCCFCRDCETAGGYTLDDDE